MSDIVYNTASTLDGYLADPDDSLSWLFAVPGADTATDDFGGFLSTIGAFVMGASTYEWVLRHGESEDPGMWEKTYGGLACFVATHRSFPTPPGARVEFVAGPVTAWLERVMDAAGERDVWLVGGGDLVGQFADIGRLDRIRVSIAPVLLGAGKPLLPRRIESDRLELLEVRRAGQFVEAMYRVSAPAQV